MAFELFIRFEGFFAYLPQNGHMATDVVFMQPSALHAKHIPRVNLCHGNLKKGDKSFRPNEHDIELWDGPTHIFGSSISVQHEFHGLPNLTPLFDHREFKDGLRQPFGPMANVASARFRIVEGEIRTSKWTDDDWYLKVENSDGAPTPIGKLALEIEYVREITSPSATLVFRKGKKREVMEFGPDGDTAIVQFLNVSQHNPKLGKGTVVSPHFRAVYELLKCTDGLPQFNLVRMGKQALGLHLPCVGGCTC